MEMLSVQPDKTRISLILRVADEQDVQAWQQFVEIYQPLVFRIAQSKGLQEADANDLVQEVMTRVARSVSNWDPDSSKGTFRGWISTIARNLVIDFLRKQKRSPLTGDDTQLRCILETGALDSPESAIFDLEHEKQVFAWAASQVKKQVQVNTWKAFWQTAVERRDPKSIAQSLDMTVGAVYIARSRVMARFRETVAACGEQLPSQHGQGTEQ